MRLAVTAPAAIAALISGCGVLGGPAAQHPAQAGPAFVVAEGDEAGGWRHEVYRTDDGFCEAITFDEGDEGTSCTAGNVEIHPQSGSPSVSSGNDRPTVAHGVVGAEVMSVSIVVRDAPPIEVETEVIPDELGLPFRAFAVAAPATSVITSISLLGDDGAVLETVDFDSGP